MLKDLMYQARVNKDYGLMVPYEEPKTPTPGPQSTTILPLQPTEAVIDDFLPEFEVREPEVRVIPPSQHELQMKVWAEETATKRKGGATIDPAFLPRSSGEDATQQWAFETRETREGKDVPAIHRHANKVLREKHLHDVRCPSCGLNFSTEVE